MMSFEEGLTGQLKYWFDGFPYPRIKSLNYSYEHIGKAYQAGWHARKAVDIELALQADEFILDPDKLPEIIADVIREKE